MKIAAENFSFRRCTIDDLDAVCMLQEKAFDVIKNPDILRRNSRDALASCLMEPHYTLGAFYGNELAAFLILFIGGDTEENLGLDLGLTDRELFLTANMKLVIVSPKFRGNGLQCILIQKVEEIAKEEGFKTLCATISPQNIYSIKNFEACGFVYHSEKKKYGGLERDIYYKKI